MAKPKPKRRNIVVEPEKKPIPWKQILIYIGVGLIVLSLVLPTVLQGLLQ